MKMLKYHPYFLSKGPKIGWISTDPPVLILNRPLIRHFHHIDGPQQRGFARSGWANDDNNFSFLDLGRYALQNLERAKSFMNVLKREHVYSSEFQDSEQALIRSLQDKSKLVQRASMFQNRYSALLPLESRAGKYLAPQSQIQGPIP